MIGVIHIRSLIVIDMQNDFITGSLGSKDAAEIVDNVKDKIRSYIENGDEVIFTRDTHHDDYLETREGKLLPIKHCIKDTFGWNIHKDIDIPSCEHIDKESFGYNEWDLCVDKSGSFHDRNFTEIEIIGLCTNMCVISNALILKSLYPEVNITVDASCCAGTSKSAHDNAIKIMRDCQIKIVNYSSSEELDTKDISEMNYSEFLMLLAYDIDERFKLIIDYDDFQVFHDTALNKYYFMECGENDADIFCEVKIIARLDYDADNDLSIDHKCAGEYMSHMFECDCCGESVSDFPSCQYLWFKIVN